MITNQTPRAARSFTQSRCLSWLKWLWTMRSETVSNWTDII